MPDESSSPPEPQAPALTTQKVTSLAEIVEEGKKTPPTPEPIALEWWLPPPPATKEKPKPQGKLMQLDIKTRFSPDPWLFGIRYMTEIKEQMRKQEAGPDGKMKLANPYADLVALAREVVLQPIWLHNESALMQLKEHVPPTTFSELRRKLMLAAGLDGDFFADYQALTIPRGWMTSALESANASANPPGPVTTKTPEISSPGSSTTGNGAMKTEEPVSLTTSGS